jgi:hypothetical protein
MSEFQSVRTLRRRRARALGFEFAVSWLLGMRGHKRGCRGVRLLFFWTTRAVYVPPFVRLVPEVDEETAKTRCFALGFYAFGDAQGPCRCELVEGHGGTHRSGLFAWAPL